MLRKAITVLVLMAASAATSAFADTLTIDAPEAAANQPSRGETQQAVESRLGTPSSKRGPVGEPPISTWEYDPYLVYFEHDRVIHTVAKR
jgi:hypothetical protein